MTSCLRIYLFGSNLNLECGATLDILRNAKNTNRKDALNRDGSSKILCHEKLRIEQKDQKCPWGWKKSGVD